MPCEGIVNIESQLGGSLIGPKIKGKLVFNISLTFSTIDI